MKCGPLNTQLPANPQSPVLAVLRVLLTALVAAASTASLQAQGTVTFDQPGITNGVSGFSLDYYNGMSFRIGNRTWPFDIPAQIGVGLAGHPNNGTPHAEFVNTLGTAQFILFAWTNAARFGDRAFTSGSPFGLLAVDLADPVAPSLAPIAITFNGFKADNSMVSQTFTVGGGGSTTFQTFLFNPDFAFGLTRVEIPSPAWAMDNLVWIPEPGTISLLLVGLLALVCRRRMR